MSNENIILNEYDTNLIAKLSDQYEQDYFLKKLRKKIGNTAKDLGKIAINQATAPTRLVLGKKPIFKEEDFINEKLGKFSPKLDAGTKIAYATAATVAGGKAVSSKLKKDNQKRLDEIEQLRTSQQDGLPPLLKGKGIENTDFPTPDNTTLENVVKINDLTTEKQSLIERLFLENKEKIKNNPLEFIEKIKGKIPEDVLQYITEGLNSNNPLVNDAALDRLNAEYSINNMESKKLGFVFREQHIPIYILIVVVGFFLIKKYVL